MVSAWWLLVAFWIGGVLGLVLGVLIASARRSRRDDAEQEEALERWIEEHGELPPHAANGTQRHGGTVPRS